MKRCFFALAVVLALFTACSSGDDQEGEELVGTVVEPDPVLGGGQGVTPVPFAYRLTGSEVQVDLSGRLMPYSRPAVYLSAKFSGIAAYENAWALTPEAPFARNTVPYGDGRLSYLATFVPPSPFVAGTLRFECRISDASGAEKAHADVTIATFDPY